MSENADGGEDEGVEGRGEGGGRGRERGRERGLEKGQGRKGRKQERRWRGLTRRQWIVISDMIRHDTWCDTSAGHTNELSSQMTAAGLIHLFPTAGLCSLHCDRKVYTRWTVAGLHLWSGKSLVTWFAKCIFVQPFTCQMSSVASAQLGHISSWTFGRLLMFLSDLPWLLSLLTRAIQVVCFYHTCKDIELITYRHQDSDSLHKDSKFHFSRLFTKAAFRLNASESPYFLQRRCMCERQCQSERLICRLIPPGLLI